MATGVSSRKSKSLSNTHPDLVSVTKQGVRQPLHPVQTSVQGTFEVKLPGLRMKSRRNEIIESDSVSLTEKGLKEIKSMIVKAPHRSHARHKDRSMKLSGTDMRLGERETKTSGQLTKTTACSEDIGESRQPVCLATGSMETEEYHIESETESRPVQEKRMPGRPPNERRHEKKLHDKRDDPIDFFGTSLLKISRKKRKKDPQTDNDTQSSEDELNKKENTSVTNAQQPRNQTGHLSGVASYSELSEQQSTATTVSQHGSWPSKISAGMSVDPLSDEMQHSDSLYKTLNMLVSGPEDVESQPGRELQHDQHQTQTKTQQHYASSKQHSTARHGAHSTLNEHNSSMTQNTDLTPTGDLDLIGLSDLPHVEGHEVEEIFAGIEREMSVDGTPRSQDQSPMETSLNEFPKSESSSFNREQLKNVKKKEGQLQGQGALKSATTASDPSSFPDAQQRVQLSQQDYRQYEMYQNNPSFQATYEQRPGQPKPLRGHSGETDAFKAVFGEEPEIRSKSREGASSPKIDGQKQLRKWEQDEKLGELATISPVLYANIVHSQLKIEYPEWPNRARAIARLWRKLPQEQREPFRLRARDNRVKQKDQGRKLANFKKPSSTPTTDSNMAFSNASPSLSSDNSDKSMGQSTAETTAIDVLSNNLMLNGESNNTGLMRTQMYQQNVSHSFAQKSESQFPEASPGYSHESNHSFGADDHSVFRQNHGQFMTGAGDDHMHDPMLLQTRSSSVVSPSITSLQKSHQSMARSSGRVPSDSNSKTFSLSDLCSPSTPSEMHFPAPGLTPTTPVFPTSPFQTIPYGADTASSPAGFISPSLPMEGSTVEKKKTKKQSKISKEQLEMEKEKKKKKLAVEQEKERQWKALQQQRLKEQQAYQQTPAIQQVLMMKEQMRKENNKPNRKSQINMGLDHDSAVLRSNVLPPVEPFSLTSNSRSMDDRSKPGSKEPAHIVTASDPVAREQTDIPIPSSFASHMDYFKDDINIRTDQESIDKALFLTKDSESHDGAVKISSDSHTSASSLDRLLEINTSEFAKIGGRSDIDASNKSNANVVVSITSSNQWVTSADISSYTTSPSYPMQHNTDQRNPTGQDPMTEFQQNKDRASADTVILHRQHSLPMTLPEQVRLSDIPGQSESQLSRTGKANQPAKANFTMTPGQAIPPVPVNIPDNLEKPAGFEQQQQQQALLFQQQQFMAAQQQYIQWQLQQRNPELFQSVTAPIQYSSYSDKDLPEVDSEEQHQERIRFLYRQRQMQKQQVVQMQQQLQQHQLIAQQQITPGSSTSTARPQVDAAQQQFMQQLLQQQQQVPEAVQQQFLMEYNRQMQQRADAGQNVMQYEKFMAELAQQYGYTMQSSNAHPVSVMQHGMTWQGAAPQGVNPNAQQMFGYGIDEEKAKDLTPQQLYQLQLQHTLMMHQMAATGMYQPTSSRNQSPIPAGSRKGLTGSNQDRSKKSRESKKMTPQEKLLRPETQQGAEQKHEDPKQNIPSSKSGDIDQVQNARETESMQGNPSVKQSDSKTPISQERTLASTQIGSGGPMIEKPALLQDSNTQSLSRESPILAGSISSSTSSNDMASRTPLGRGETDSNAGKDVITHTSNLHQALPKASISQNETISNELLSSTAALKQTVLSRSDVVNNILDKNIHGYPNTKATEKNTDSKSKSDHQIGSTSKSKDHENEKPTQKVICNDGIHCGTDSEDESYQNERDTLLAKKASDLIKEGNTVKDTGRSVIVPKAVCSDGIHCGTDSEDEEQGKMTSKGNTKPICSDGIHCGTDSEDDERQTGVPKGNVKSVCSDGIHCGTDSEDEGCRTKMFPVSKVKSVCSDGIHCGTDSEDENQIVDLKQKVKKVCSDGIHCGTDSEDEGVDAKKYKENSGENSKVEGVRNATNKQGTCSDGIHCGTDSEEENEPNLKSQKHQSASDKASDKSRSTGKPVVCNDGIHCGTDSENEDDKAKSSKEAKDLKEKPTGPSQDSSGNQSQITPQPGQISTSMSGTSGSIFSPSHTLEVIQEGDVMVNSLGALEVGLREAKNDAKLSGSVDNDFGLSSHEGSLKETASVKDEQKSVPSCAVGQQQHPEMHQSFIDQIKKSNPSLIPAVSGAQIIQASLPKDLQHSLAEKTSVISSSKIQQIELQPHQQRDNTQPQQQMFSPPPSTPSAMHQDAQSRQRPKFSGIPPMSPQYQKVFLHQHQLLIMQFQQYQYQLQAQFQQLSQQQMSPQQQFLLQQQYHQQIVLLQRQFVQQQAQLQAMASAGMQFTEQELNFMYQQQMVAQQAYNHWIATLSLDQQGQLHARMQANMQQVQQAMAATMQNAAKSASESVKEKVKKPRGRRPRKNKTESTDPPTPAPNTPSLPPTPASGGDAALPSTPNKDQAATPDLIQRNRNQRTIYPPDTHSFAGSSAVGQGSQIPPDFMNDKRQIQSNQQGQQGIQYASGPIQQSLPGQMQSVDQQSYPGENVQNLPAYHQSQGSINQQLMPMQGREWQQIGSDARHPSQQHQPDSSMQQQNKSITGQIPNSQHSNLPRVHIVPGGSNPFSDVYREIEKKTKVPSQMNTPTMDPKTGAAFQGTQNYAQDQWKSMQAEEFHQPGSGNSTPRIPSTTMHSESVFYYPSPSGNPPSIPQQPHSASAYPAKSRGHVSASLPQGSSDGHRLYPEQPASQAQYFDQSRDHLHQDTQNSSMTDVGSLNQSQTTGQNVTQYPAHSTIISQIDHTAVQPVYDSHGQRSNLAMDGVTDSNWPVSLNEQSYMHAAQGRQLSTPRLQNVPGGNTEMDAAQAQHLQTTNSQNVLADERLMPPPPKYENTSDKAELPPYSMTLGQVNKLDAEQEIANRLSNIGSVDSKEQPKALQKRKRGGQSSQMATASVDFSLLNPEEQKRFILERKREDFERRKRIVEDQKQQKLKDQRNFKTAGRKIDKKLPRTKQQRKLKGGRDKLPTDKSPLPSRLLLDDKSLKLPLCEPEVRLLYPLVQPYGSGYTNGETLLFGVFGNARVQGTNDYYSQFPSPDPPVTSSNPPTPPASLPPSPGTINQSLRDSLQMIPTEGIFDDLTIAKRPKDDLTLFGADLDRQNTSSFYSPVEHPSSSEAPHSKDDVMVTLTMSNDRSRTPNDRVSNVADILGVAKPNRIKIKEESRTDGGINEPDLDSADPRPLATSIGKEKDVHFSCLESENASNDPEKNKAPFCKHCDISIQGSGYIECKDTDESGLIKVDNLSYKKIAINSGQELFDVFCSQMCLRSFHSLSKPLPGALRNDPTNTDDSGQLIDPVRSVIPVSTGDPSSVDFTRTNPEDIEMRGAEQAEGISPRIPRRRSLKEDGLERETKRPRCVIWKRWRIEFSPKPGKKESVKTSVIELLERYGAALKIEENTKDERECMLCGDKGDGVTEGTARLINYDVDVWVHLNCALWSLEVYETLNGALHNVQKAYERGIQTACVYCGKKGATVTCARVIGAQMRRCDMNYHFNCAIRAHCTFFKDKTVLCPQHKNYGSVDQRLPSYAVLRKVYVNRDITKQLASVLRLNNEKEQKVYTIRVGSLIFHELGQLLPHQLQKFHTKEAIYPIGFQTTRIYWSTTRLGRRCRYLCTVGEQDNNPHFTVTVEDSESKVGQYAGSTPKEIWSCILEPVRKLREEAKMVKIFPEFMTGEDLFGLTDPSLQRIIESLPGVDTFHDYSFRFGRTPMIMAELPLAVNPTGCIRSESTRHVHLNRPVSLRTASSPPSERGDRADSSVDDNSQGSMLRNNWAMTKTAQYRKLKSDWKNIVLLSKSRIQGLGLFATRDIEPNTMIIEYIGSLIRNEVANKRERIYEDANRGVYMFRVDSDTVIDATMTGGPARYINHSCDPNCVAEVVVIEKMPKIIIISNRKIDQGEELTYDYKFEFEDDQHKIACLCGAANCRKWMN